MNPLVWALVAAPLLGQAQTALLAGEYFWNTDPGAGNGLPVVAVDGTFGDALEQVLAEAAVLPAPGQHRLGIRVQGANGTWGPVFTTVVEILPGAVSFPAIEVTQGEYFWDTDPGLGNGTPLLALDGSFGDALEAVYADLSGLPGVGAHVLSLRMRDVNNAWGPLVSVVVEVLPGSISFPDVQVTAAEYWVDVDPGEGAATPLIAVDNVFNDAWEALRGGAVPAPVVAGVQVLWTRARDANGQWGPAFGVVVNIDTTITGTVSVPATGADAHPLVLPNPVVSGEGIWVEQRGDALGFEVTVLDSRGRLVSRSTHPAADRTFIALPALPAGMYPVGILMGDAAPRWTSLVVR